MREKVLALLQETCPGIDFENEKALIDDELLASLDIITIVSELMYRFGVELDVDDLLPENFNDLDAITALVEERL
ncbi:MAG: acyl carrier protein [Firmicutes bacterium]|nr:acyl carrier protein [Bacillota bacterium]